jgi:hypothetical protein
MPNQETGSAQPGRRRGSSRRAAKVSLPVLTLALLVPAFAIAVALTTHLGSVPKAFPSAPGAPILRTGPATETEARARIASQGLAVERWQNQANVLLIEPGAWSDRSFEMVDEALALLPDGVRAQLGNPALGPLYVSVNREGRTLSGLQPYQREANFFSTNEGRNEIVLFPDQTSRTALHELGHAYNLRHIPAGSYAQVFADEEMQSFLKAAQWRVLTSPGELRHMRDHADVKVAYDGAPVWSRLSRNDPLEDFANSFALYFTSPAELKALSPSRFQWFADQFGRLENFR